MTTLKRDSKAIEDVRKGLAYARRQVSEFEKKIDHYNDMVMTSIENKEEWETAVTDFEYILYLLDGEIEEAQEEQEESQEENQEENLEENLETEEVNNG